MRMHRLRPVTAAVALAVSAAVSPVEPVVAEEDTTLRDLTEPETTFRVGAGYLSDSNSRFGEYNGMADSTGYALLDLEFLRRNDSTGAWWSVTGRNLGLDSRELRAEYDSQGSWGAYLEFNQIPRLYPLTINTGLLGIGTTTQVLNGTALRDVDLSTRRDRYTMGFDTRLPGEFALQVEFRDETKEGSRIFGRGSGQFLAEPIDSRSQQMEAILSYTGRRLQLAGGYFATNFSNRNILLDVDTGTDISLPPDNESHQLYISGGYNFAPATRATFKMAYGRATQDERFFTAPDFPGNTRENLDGRIDTTTAYVGFSTRPLPRLSLLANARYEDRDDKTPRYQFLAATTGRDGFNTPFSRSTAAGKLEATYVMPLDIAVTGGVDVERRKRTVLAIRQVSWREENDETTYRIEARRTLSESLNGALSFAHSDRGGSDYLPANNNEAVDHIDPIHFADRKRDKVRLLLDWTPVESLSLQFMLDDSRDSYSGRPLGPDRGTARMYSVDGAYTLSDTWQVNAWLSHDETRMRQSTITGANGVTVPAQTWQADMRNVGDAFGAGVRGRLSAGLAVGADIQYLRDENDYRMLAVVPDAVMLPNIDTKRFSLEVFGQYAIRDNLDLRLDLAYDRFRTNDWTWTNWVYADGTTVELGAHKSSTFIGISVYYGM